MHAILVIQKNLVQTIAKELLFAEQVSQTLDTIGDNLYVAIVCK